MEAKAIYHLLSNEPDVTGIVADRIYPDTAEQTRSGAYIVFFEVDTDPTNTKQAPSQMDMGRWQVDGYCEKADERDALKAAIRKALDFVFGPVNGVPIEQIRFMNSNGNFDDDGEKFRCSQDFRTRKHRS